MNNVHFLGSELHEALSKFSTLVRGSNLGDRFLADILQGR